MGFNSGFKGLRQRKLKVTCSFPCAKVSRNIFRPDKCSESYDVTHLRYVRQHVLQCVAVEVRLLGRVLHVDDVQELQGVHSRIAATQDGTVRTPTIRLR